MSRPSSPFSPRVVLGLVVVGGAAFLLFLYALGAGWTGGDRSTGSGHAASKGLNGYAALVELLERRGHQVSLSRTPGRLDERALLVLTPPHFADGEDIAALVERRRWEGPTIVVLPKWFAVQPDMAGIKDAPRGWVALGGVESPDWLTDFEDLEEARIMTGTTRSWSGFGLAGSLPDPANVQALSLPSVRADDGTTLIPLVTDAEGDVLAGYLNDDGVYPALDDAGGFGAPETPDDSLWPVVFVAEPDLLNNYGLADRGRAELAVAIVEATVDEYELPILFDLTLPGLGRSENLLTLAFEPPFLAVTLTLLLAALAIGWRAFVRFGPPLAEAPALAGGKAQLARNGAALVERARRFRLVGPPYAALVAQRIGAALGLPERADAERRAAAISHALARRGEDPEAFARESEALRQATRPADLLRAAKALKSIERMFTR